MKRRSSALLIAATLGFVFLYAPIASLIVYSFNANKLVTVWSGFSTKWYGELLKDEQILGAAWLSIQVAFLSATIGVILGTLAAFALARFGRFRSRLLLTGMVTAPLVMPEVIVDGAQVLLRHRRVESDERRRASSELDPRHERRWDREQYQ